jgi:hypothetical protein
MAGYHLSRRSRSFFPPIAALAQKTKRQLPNKAIGSLRKERREKNKQRSPMQHLWLANWLASGADSGIIWEHGNVGIWKCGNMEYGPVGGLSLLPQSSLFDLRRTSLFCLTLQGTLPFVSIADFPRHDDSKSEDKFSKSSVDSLFP